jgi:hypothetical protein
MDLNRFLTRLSLNRYRKLASTLTSDAARERLLQRLQIDTAEHRNLDLHEQQLKTDPQTDKPPE